MTIRSRLAAAMFTALTPLPVLAQEVAWQVNVPGPVRWIVPRPGGSVVLGSAKYLFALRTEGALRLWEYAAEDSIKHLIEAGPRTYLLVHGDTVALLDTESGLRYWVRGDLPTGKDLALHVSDSTRLALFHTTRDATVVDLDSGTTRWTASGLDGVAAVRDLFWHRQAGVVLLVVRGAGQEQSVVLVGDRSGEILWRADSAFTERLRFVREDRRETVADRAYPVVLPDSGAVLHFSKEGPVRISRDGRLAWRATALAGSRPPAATRDFPRMRLTDSLLLVPQERGLVAVRLDDGTLAWRSTPALPDHPTEVRPVRHGILVGGLGRARPFVTLLDPGTGRAVWPAPVTLHPHATARELRDTLYAADQRELLAIPLATGVPRRLAQIPFGPGASARRLDVADSTGIIVFDREHLFRVRPDGSVAYSLEYDYPAPSVLGQIAGFALLVGTGIMAASSPTGGPILSFSPGGWRGDVSAGGRRWVFLTNAKVGPGMTALTLVAVDPTDGAETGRLPIGESALYRVDQSNGFVYLVEGEERVVAHRWAAVEGVKSEK